MYRLGCGKIGGRGLGGAGGRVPTGEDRTNSTGPVYPSLKCRSKKRRSRGSLSWAAGLGSYPSRRSRPTGDPSGQPVSWPSPRTSWYRSSPSSKRGVGEGSIPQQDLWGPLWVRRWLLVTPPRREEREDSRRRHVSHENELTKVTEHKTNKPK